MALGLDHLFDPQLGGILDDRHAEEPVATILQCALMMATAGRRTERLIC